MRPVCPELRQGRGEQGQKIITLARSARARTGAADRAGPADLAAPADLGQWAPVFHVGANGQPRAATAP
jgi:hypothetical protein